MNKKILVLLMLMLPCSLFAANGTIRGHVVDAVTGEPLTGTQIIIENTNRGVTTGDNGSFRLEKVVPGTITVKATFIGYETITKTVQVNENSTSVINFDLQPGVIMLTGITVMADRAKERETPVAFTDVRKEEITARLGSRDIPLVLNTTPSIYATASGGGAGDSRVNVRGFDQKNVAIMINGVPVNDMENGWVYWSNWDGVADATSSIQVQRGLSAVNLATPSIGGTMNIITDPTSQKAGAMYRQEIGNDGFLKTTVNAATGLIGNKYAISGTIVRKLGDGTIDKTWTDAWAYYLGASYNINKNNRLEVYALGAPQRHGQSLYKQNIAAFSHSFAKDLSDYDPAALEKFKESKSGLKYNQNWNTVSSSFTGKQYTWNGENDRYASDFINERENYYHKPIINLNWYSRLTEKMNTFTTVYYSGGNGGGSGTAGKVIYDKTSEPSQIVDWDATIANNKNPETAKDKVGILRNSRNNQWTIGAISKADYKFSNALNVTAGIDWRYAKIDHFQEVRDLLGAEYYLDKASDFYGDEGKKCYLGDIIAYDFTNTVNWYGLFSQAEYKKGNVTAYGMAGFSSIKYNHENRFLDDGAGSPHKVSTDWINGYQVKGGANYRFNDWFNLFGNLGYVSKVPIFDYVIDDGSGSKTQDPKNETFNAVEIGANTYALDNKLNIKANFYYTTWKDRSQSLLVTSQDGAESLVFLSGVDEIHTGIEFEAAYQPLSIVRLDASASFGSWKNTDDVTGFYKTYTDTGLVSKSYNYYIKDLKVGDAPQTQFAISGSIMPVKGATAQVTLRHYMDHYSYWDPFSRTDKKDRKQSWQAPDYTVIDLHAYYKLPLSLRGVNLQIFAHVFNALDELYIQDAVDNSKYNGFDKDHDADDAEVYFGIPRTFNIGLQLNY